MDVIREKWFGLFPEEYFLSVKFNRIDGFSMLASVDTLGKYGNSCVFGKINNWCLVAISKFR